MKNILFIAVLLLTSLSSINAQESSQEKFKPYGDVFGEVFGDYYYKVASSGVDSLLDGLGEYKKKAKDDNAFSLRRFYLGYKYNFSKQFSAKLMFEGNDGNLISGNKRGVNIKYYYLQWNDILPNANLIIGGQSTPSWSRFTEKVWNYRRVEKTIMDFRHDGVSNDFGVSLSGKLTKKKIIGYELMVGNGTAQKPENDRNKKVYGSVNARLLDKTLLLELYFDNEKDADNMAINIVKGFIAYQKPSFTIGAEPYQKRFFINGSKASSFGTTIFAYGQIIKDKLNALARWDFYNRDVNDVDLSNINNTYTEKFLVFGLDYTPMKNVSIIPNIWVNSYDKKTSSPYPDKESDIIARITFHYKF